MQMAIEAAERQVFKNRLSAMLSGDDAIDMERLIVKRRGESAVFANLPRPRANLLFENAVHASRGGMMTLERLPGLGVRDRQQVSDKKIAIQLASFVRIERPLRIVGTDDTVEDVSFRIEKHCRSQ
ncbi:MAG TPA: hypothetical protein VK797_24355 [Tepidisphaeraceae bacterium]|nr:hypothetical protein [Tepidisphaeraceae bacterium]